MQDGKAGHRSRIKAKYLENSANLVYDYEVLELLLTYAIPRRDVKPVAKALLERFGSLEKVLSASSRQLCTVSGIGYERGDAHHACKRYPAQKRKK